MCEPGENDPRNCPHYEKPEEFGNKANLGDAPVKQEQGDEDNSYRQKCRSGDNPAHAQSPEQWELKAPLARGVLCLKTWEEIRAVLRKANCPGRDRQRRAERKLPDEEK